MFTWLSSPEDESVPQYESVLELVQSHVQVRFQKFKTSSGFFQSFFSEPSKTEQGQKCSLVHPELWVGAFHKRSRKMSKSQSQLFSEWRSVLINSRLTTLPTTNLGTIMDIISKVLKEMRYLTPSPQFFFWGGGLMMMTKQEQVADDDEAGVGWWWRWCYSWAGILCLF